MDHSSSQYFKDVFSKNMINNGWWKKQSILEADRLEIKRYGEEPVEYNWVSAYYCMRKSETNALTKSKSAGCTKSLIYLGYDPSYNNHSGVFSAIDYPKSFAVMIEDPRVYINAENVFYRCNGHRDLIRIATCRGKLETVRILLGRNNVNQVSTAFACAEGLEEPNEMIELFIRMGKAPVGYKRNQFKKETMVSRRNNTPRPFTEKGTTMVKAIIGKPRANF